MTTLGDKIRRLAIAPGDEVLGILEEFSSADLHAAFTRGPEASDDEESGNLKKPFFNKKDDLFYNTHVIQYRLSGGMSGVAAEDHVAYGVGRRLYQAIYLFILQKTFSNKTEQPIVSGLVDFIFQSGNWEDVGFFNSEQLPDDLRRPGTYPDIWDGGELRSVEQKFYGYKLGQDYDNSLISFKKDLEEAKLWGKEFSDLLAYSMKNKADLWSNIPNWDVFLKRNAIYGFEQFDKQILLKVKQVLKDKIAGMSPVGYQFTPVEPMLNLWERNPINNLYGSSYEHLKNLADYEWDKLPSEVAARIHEASGADPQMAIPDNTELLSVLRQAGQTPGNVPTSKFPERTLADIIGPTTIFLSDVKYNKTYVADTSRSSNGFSSLVNRRFIVYIKSVMDSYTNGLSPQSIGGLFVNALGVTLDTNDRTAWEEAWQLMAVMQENIERQTFVTNYDPDRTSDNEVDDLRKEIEGQREKDLEDRANSDGEPEDLEESPDAEERIKGRQKFFKQCALLLNALRLKKLFTGELSDRLQSSRTDGYSEPSDHLFDERLYMLENESSQNLINKLRSTMFDSLEFNHFPSRIFTYLTPVVRLWKVKSKGNKQEQTEFIFSPTTDLNRQSNFEKPTVFSGIQFDKGDGCGLKDFSFEFNGTNPAEARNDIEASMTLYFQSFADFLRERISYNGETYRFVDLLIQPVEDDKKQKKIHPNHYDPSFYKILVQVGYSVPDNFDDLFPRSAAPLGQSFEYDKLSDAVSGAKELYYLCMIDHEININPDGSVTIKINYRAYVETALKSNLFDALATREIVNRRLINEQTLNQLLSSGKCSQRQIQELKLTFAGEEQTLRNESLKSIVKRLYDRKKIFTVRVPEEEAAFFREFGYFNNPKFQFENFDSNENNTPSGNLDPTVVDFILKNKLSSLDEWDYTDKKDRNIQFFYFADLLHTISDVLYDGNKFHENFDGSRFLLANFQFNPYTAAKSGHIDLLNVGEIPISVDYFLNWFVNNVVSQGNARKSFPILIFIRNLLNNLLGQSLLEVCINKDVEKTFRFQTSSFILTSNDDGKQPLSEFCKVNRKKNIFYPYVRSEELEFYSNSYDTDLDPENRHNFSLISTVGSDLSLDGAGDESNDYDRRIPHFHIGSNVGMVKNISFSKSDMQYVREARFFSQGTDGLLQLSAVYVATIEMFGNVFYYPGQTIYINPFGMGGTELGSPTQGPSTGDASLANKLGFGGYHTITSVKSTINNGQFTTTITAQWYYSGDGANNFHTTGRSNTLDQSDSLSDVTEEISTKYCDTIIAKSQSNLAKLQKGSSLDSLADLRGSDPPDDSELPEINVDLDFMMQTQEEIGLSILEFKFENTSGIVETDSIDGIDETKNKTLGKWDQIYDDKAPTGFGDGEVIGHLECFGQNNTTILARITAYVDATRQSNDGTGFKVLYFLVAGTMTALGNQGNQIYLTPDTPFGFVSQT